MIYKDFKELSLSRLGMGNMSLPTKLGRIDQKKARESYYLATKFYVMANPSYRILVSRETGNIEVP